MKIKNQKKWVAYSKSAWDSAGRPTGLDPQNILDNPAQYDQHYYEYFERRYIDLWLSVYSEVNPINGVLLKRESKTFRDAWERNFNWGTIWKQILPFFVYGSAFGVRNEILIELSSWYCLGQAIPSVIIDRFLDEYYKEGSKIDLAFCILAYNKALNGIRATNLPCKEKLEDTFISLTGEMYDKMLVENSSRFNSIPKFMVDAISEYLLPNSRLLSSVFFGILPIWACILSNQNPSEEIINSTKSLRTVRQLNDEILDVREDIQNGLITLPWLYAMEENPNLKNTIEEFWRGTNNKTAATKCFNLLKETSGLERASSKSLEILSQSMTISQKIFSSKIAFDITLLHNARWSLINWVEQCEYDREPSTIREPKSPQDCLLNDTHPIEPVPGAGALVFNSENKVLMTLVLKRGMLRWELPAGVSKGNESLEETAQRETNEETGKDIKVCDVVAMCWHYSRELNKGWMGTFFRGDLVSNNETENNFTVITREAFAHNKFNLWKTPELYRSIKLESCDFEEVNNLCETHFLYPAAFENVIASGFVDWTKIPPERMHPLHYQILNSYKKRTVIMEPFVSDADKDYENYDPNSKLYHTN